MREIVEVNKKRHGVEGMAGSLDCTHLSWQQCPNAWKGQFSGKGKKPTVLIEAVADHNLWIHHAWAGAPGNDNDVTIFNHSPLRRALVDGTFDKYDFAFEMGGEEFNQVWMLVDGIYPELSRFVKTVTEGWDDESRAFKEWQEGARKDIERAFGVLKKNFRFISSDIQKLCFNDMVQSIKACVVLHNMMVEHRVNCKEEESDTLYYSDIPSAQGGGDENRRIANDPLDTLWSAVERWRDLQSETEHYRLRDSTMRHVALDRERTTGPE